MDHDDVDDGHDYGAVFAANGGDEFGLGEDDGDDEDGALHDDLPLVDHLTLEDPRDGGRRGGDGATAPPAGNRAASPSTGASARAGVGGSGSGRVNRDSLAAAAAAHPPAERRVVLLAGGHAVPRDVNVLQAVHLAAAAAGDSLANSGSILAAQHMLEFATAAEAARAAAARRRGGAARPRSSSGTAAVQPGAAPTTYCRRSCRGAPGDTPRQRRCRARLPHPAAAARDHRRGAAVLCGRPRQRRRAAGALPRAPTRRSSRRERTRGCSSSCPTSSRCVATLCRSGRPRGARVQGRAALRDAAPVRTFSTCLLAVSTCTPAV